jgi:outer membrane receptor for ferrienterochelin and colicins
MDKHSLIRNPIFSPRVNIRYNPFRRLSFRISYSTGFRAPQAYDEDLHVALADGERIISTLAPDLKEERSHSASLSVDYCLYKGGVDVDLTGEGFFTYLKDIFAERRYEDAAGNEVSERYNADKGYVAGANLSMRIAWKRWLTAQLGATWQVSRYNEPLEWSEEAAPEIRMLRTPNIYGYLILESNPWRQLTLNVTGNLTGPMLVPHELEEPVLVKTPTFFVLNAQVSYDFRIKLQQKWSESMPDRIVLQVTAGIRNITDAYQRDLDVGPTRDGSYIYGPMMPRSVYLGVKVGL